MTTLAGDRPLFIQVVAGDTEPVRCRLAPVVDFTILFVMTLPALAFGKRLVLEVGKIEHFSTHFQFYQAWTVFVGLGSLQLCSCNKDSNKCRDQEK